MTNKELLINANESYGKTIDVLIENKFSNTFIKIFINYTLCEHGIVLEGIIYWIFWIIVRKLLLY